MARVTLKTLQEKIDYLEKDRIAIDKEHREHLSTYHEMENAYSKSRFGITQLEGQIKAFGIQVVRHQNSIAEKNTEIRILKECFHDALRLLKK